MLKPEYITDKSKEIKIFLLVFYAVGIIGVIVPFTFVFFSKLIPYALFINFVLLAIFHSPKVDGKTLIIFLGIFLLSYTIEVVGVNTGFIFGSYHYGENLGIKILNTPLIIGINWLFLVYTTSSVTNKMNVQGPPAILLASTMMLVYDIILEPVAPYLDMWHWENERVPFQNYLAWFFLALLFHSAIKVSGIRTQNKLAIVMLICQFAFFLSLYINIKIIH